MATQYSLEELENESRQLLKEIIPNEREVMVASIIEILDFQGVLKKPKQLRKKKRLENGEFKGSIQSAISDLLNQKLFPSFDSKVFPQNLVSHIKVFLSLIACAYFKQDNNGELPRLSTKVFVDSMFFGFDKDEFHRIVSVIFSDKLPTFKMEREIKLGSICNEDVISQELRQAIILQCEDSLYHHARYILEKKFMGNMKSKYLLKHLLTNEGTLSISQTFLMEKQFSW
jgi:hypothetical protein